METCGSRRWLVRLHQECIVVEGDGDCASRRTSGDNGHDGLLALGAFGGGQQFQTRTLVVGGNQSSNCGNDARPTLHAQVAAALFRSGPAVCQSIRQVVLLPTMPSAIPCPAFEVRVL